VGSAVLLGLSLPFLLGAAALSLLAVMELHRASWRWRTRQP